MSCTQAARWKYNEFGWVTNKVDQSNTEILRYTTTPMVDSLNRLTDMIDTVGITGARLSNALKAGSPVISQIWRPPIIAAP